MAADGHTTCSGKHDNGGCKSAQAQGADTCCVAFKDVVMRSV